MTTPIISVIICTYNTKDLTLDCLERVKKSIEYLKKPVETIVVENGNDGTGEMIKKKLPWVKLIEPSENTGFAKGNNLGIKLSDKKTKYFLLLNTDALIEKETLAKAVEFMESHDNSDVMGCRLKFGDGRMQPSAGFLPTPENTTYWMLGLDSLTDKQVHPKAMDFFQKDRKVEWVMGAFLFMKSEVVKKTRGFDENFFMYMEEVEWCKRINDAGFQIWYTPSFEITHLDKASSGYDIKKPLTREIQGLSYYLKKYFPGSMTTIKIVIWLGVLIRFVGFGIKGDRLRANIYKDIFKVL